MAEKGVKKFVQEYFNCGTDLQKTEWAINNKGRKIEINVCVNGINDSEISVRPIYYGEEARDQDQLSFEWILIRYDKNIFKDQLLKIDPNDDVWMMIEFDGTKINKYHRHTLLFNLIKIEYLNSNMFSRIADH